MKGPDKVHTGTAGNSFMPAPMLVVSELPLRFSGFLGDSRG